MANVKGKNEKSIKGHLNIEYRLLEYLQPNPKNPRKSTPEQIKKLAESIKANPAFFEARPILLSERTGELVIIGGERRSEAAKLLGMDTVPTILLSGLSETQEDEIMIKDNTHAGVWDEQKLAQWGKEQLQGWNVDGVKWPKQATEIKEDDFNPDAKVEPRVKFGDVWQLGRHRLMCGDSTKKDDVLILTGGGKIDICLTDPPYGISIVKTTGKIGGDKPATFGKTLQGWEDGKIMGNVVQSTVYHAIKGDETTDTALKSFEIMKELSNNQIIFGGNYFTDFLPPKACWVVWDKMNGDSVFADVELAWTSFDKGAKLIQWMWNGMARAGDRKTEGVKRIHPTQKPVGLFVKIINEFSKENENIMDLFAGSGPLVIAAEQTNRNAFMMEYEPYYCDVIITRWEQFTGQKAKKIN